MTLFEMQKLYRVEWDGKMITTVRRYGFGRR